MAPAQSCVLVYGSVNCDEFYVVDHIVRPGETISSTSYSRRAGGKGANQAVAAARAGAQVVFAGAIGQDGAWLVDELNSYGVGTSLLLTDEKTATGRAIIQLSSADGDNSIVLFPGSNFAGNQNRSLDMSQHTHLLCQNEIPWTETVRALEQAHQSGLATFFNPSPMPTAAQLQALDWRTIHWLLINEGEGRDLLAAYGAPVSDTASPQESLERLRTALGGSTAVIMTLGAQGAAAITARGDIVAAPAGILKSAVKDTTGAGDCFTGFLATLLTAPIESGAELEPILAKACQAAAMCVEKSGAMESVPELAQVEERMSRR
ncbi:hypothetical protein JCM8202_001695 [Rhodotorula sphaerocarpa]